MRSEVVPTIMPEEWELKKKQIELSSYETVLAQQELDLTTLHAELNLFQTHYLMVLGELYSRLDDIEAKIAEILAQNNPGDREAWQKASEARAQADESAQAAESARTTDETGKINQQYSFKPSENLKKLYREIAKRIHPDLATNEKQRERYQQLMSEANRAYKDDDEAGLQNILHQWEGSPDAIQGDGCGAKLVRMIRKIAQVKARLRAIQTELFELKESSLYQLKLKVEAAEGQGRDLLAEMAVFLSQQIIKTENQLHHIAISNKVACG